MTFSRSGWLLECVLIGVTALGFSPLLACSDDTGSKSVSATGAVPGASGGATSSQSGGADSGGPGNAPSGGSLTAGGGPGGATGAGGAWGGQGGAASAGYRGGVLPGYVNIEPSVAPYGQCRDLADESRFESSHWCKTGAVSGAPTRADLKYGRHTIYDCGNDEDDRAGCDGSSVAACMTPLGQREFVEVAVSTKYFRGPIDQAPNYCGQCMCVRIRGADTVANPGAVPAEYEPYVGTVFKAVVTNCCPECPDDSFDILNTKAYRSFVTPGSVGTWTAEWNFVNCETNCDAFFSD